MTSGKLLVISGKWQVKDETPRGVSKNKSKKFPKEFQHQLLTTNYKL